MKVATFLTQPLPIGQIYVCGIFVEHSLEIFNIPLRYSQYIRGKFPMKFQGIPK